MSALNHLVYQSYIQLMHGYCQYPQLRKLLLEENLGSDVAVLALGKAAWKMAAVSAGALRERGISYTGIILTKYGGSHGAVPGFQLLEAGHPVPDANSLHAGKLITDWLRTLKARQELVILISGGSSALFETLPRDWQLEDLIRLNRDLLRSGKPIQEINDERARVSLVKGGKALDLAKCRQVRVYAVSDVMDNDPRTLGSGPFTPPDSGQKTSWGWLYTNGGKKVEYRIIVDNSGFRLSLAEDLKQQGFRVQQEEAYQSCTVDQLAAQIKELLRRAHAPRFRLKPPFMRLWGGELTLPVHGSGLGGRCSHLALSLVSALSKYPNCALFCFATDGCDNIPGSGGAYVDSLTAKSLRRAGIGLGQARQNYDSFTALKAIHQILPSPLLSTNVNDIFLLSVGYDLDNPNAGLDNDAYDIFDNLP